MGDKIDGAEFWRALRAQHPPFLQAVAADARITARRRGETVEPTNRRQLAALVVRLSLESDAFIAQVCYRAKAAAQTRRIPVVPFILHRLAIMLGQIAIGDPVIIAAGVYIPHGQVVIDGFTRIGYGSVIGPFASIGLVAGEWRGPTIGEYVSVGTSASLLGYFTVGDRAKIGAGAVVLGDVPADGIAVGVPARVVNLSNTSEP